jgi:hypothetical protein
MIRQKQIFIFNYYQSTTQDSGVKKISNHDPFCGSGMTHTGYDPTLQLIPDPDPTLKQAM